MEYDIALTIPTLVACVPASNGQKSPDTTRHTLGQGPHPSWPNCSPRHIFSDTKIYNLRKLFRNFVNSLEGGEIFRSSGHISYIVTSVPRGLLWCSPCQTLIYNSVLCKSGGNVKRTYTCTCFPQQPSAVITNRKGNESGSNNCTSKSGSISGNTLDQG